MNEAIKKVKLENEVVKARTDSKAELIEPIDFSFKDLMKFEGWKFYMKLFFINIVTKISKYLIKISIYFRNQ